MTKFGKFLIGGAVTSLLAWGSVSIGGEKLINGLQARAQSTFASEGFGPKASVTMQHDPLARTAIVSGEYDDNTRKAISDKLLAIPGISGVRFASAGAADAAASAASTASAPPASEEQVENCQAGVNQIMEGQSINFASGSAEITPESSALLDKLGTAIKGCAGMKVAIGGHTDATGSDAVNTPLSKARADAVAAALAERGVSADSMTTQGYGSSKPKVSGSSSAANAQNRRIEFTFSATNAQAAQGE